MADEPFSSGRSQGPSAAQAAQHGTPPANGNDSSGHLDLPEGSNRWSESPPSKHHLPPHLGRRRSGDYEEGDRVYDMSMPMEEGVHMGMGSPLMQSDRMDGNGGKGIGGGKGAAIGGRGAGEFGSRSNAPKDVREHVKAVIDQTSELQQPFVVRNLAWTYFLTVLVVFLLSLGGQIAVSVYINNSYSDAVVVNVSGRQRMLSQLLTKDALALMYIALGGAGANAPNATYFVSEMKQRVKIWDEAFHGLVNGSSSMGLPGTSNGKILELYKDHDQHYHAMFNAIQTILALPNITSLSPNSTEFQILKDQMDILLENEGPFWKTQDTITLTFQEEADSHLKFIYILSWVLHGLVILTLLLEGIFILWPVTRALQRLIDERFNLIRRSLEAEAQNRGVSMLMMGYISHELEQPLESLREHLAGARDFLSSVEANVSAAAAAGAGDGGEGGSGGRQGGRENQGSESEGTKLEEERQGGGGGGGGGHGGVGEGLSMKAEEESLDPTTQSVRGAVRRVEQAQTCCELIGTVVGDIANLRSIELGRMALVVEEVDVMDVVQQTMVIVSDKVPEDVSIRIDMVPATETEHYRLDKHRLQQVLLNLVDNALRHTREGEVVVRMRPSERPNMLRLEVEDNGGGLSAEQREAMLREPLMDSGGMEEGAGNLAVYVVKLLVDLQSGTFGVDTEEGRGSTYWVELPATSDSSMLPVSKPDATKINIP